MASVSFTNNKQYDFTVSDVDRMLTVVLSKQSNANTPKPSTPPPAPQKSPPTPATQPSSHSLSSGVFTIADTTGYKFLVSGLKSSLVMVPHNDKTVISSQDALGAKNPLELGSFVSINGPADATKALKVHGQLQTTDKLTALAVDAKDIGFGANRIRFTDAGIIFDGHVVNASLATSAPPRKRNEFVERELILDALSEHASGGFGIKSKSKPIYSDKSDVSLLWQIDNGLHQKDGTLVPVTSRSRWEMSGGNFLMKGEEGFNYMFAIEGGYLSLYRVDGTTGINELITRFGKA
eukprot:gene2306-8596_t